MVKRIRLAAVLGCMALLPFASVAHADANQDAIDMVRLGAMQQNLLVQSNNDLRRCQMAMAGQPVPPTVNFSQNAPANIVMACTPSTSSGSPTNTATSGVACLPGPFTTFQQNLINDWAISVQKANNNKTAAPAMPPEVAALIGAC